MTYNHRPKRIWPGSKNRRGRQKEVWHRRLCRKAGRIGSEIPARGSRWFHCPRHDTDYAVCLFRHPGSIAIRFLAYIQGFAGPGPGRLPGRGRPAKRPSKVVWCERFAVAYLSPDQLGVQIVWLFLLPNPYCGKKICNRQASIRPDFDIGGQRRLGFLCDRFIKNVMQNEFRSVLEGRINPLYVHEEVWRVMLLIVPNISVTRKTKFRMDTVVTEQESRTGMPPPWPKTEPHLVCILIRRELPIMMPVLS